MGPRDILTLFLSNRIPDDCSGAFFAHLLPGRNTLFASFYYFLMQFLGQGVKVTVQANLDLSVEAPLAVFGAIPALRLWVAKL